MNNDVEHFFNAFIGHLYILTLKCLLRPLSFLSAVLLGYLFFLTNLEKLFKKLCNFIKKNPPVIICITNISLILLYEMGL